MQEYVERHAKFQEQATATGDVGDLLESGQKIKYAIKKGHETNAIMKETNQDLAK